MDNNILITVYGAEQICASCVGAPGSKDTYEWLQAAISRKYINDNMSYEYIDIENPPNNRKHRELAERILDDEYFYPLVLINDNIVAEGIPRLKSIYRELDKNGAVVQS
ncbi:putative disulfide oxidoreductase YuzD [Lentibacillus kapialis]|uniref:Disulfide oxidoreductase YuzD n=1 Tax=Lentibacillus kapialis TaxID=340214 RepID=A0A917V0H9_9BACI|nr:YuzD family protein [Lentibacillus kapialis]GGK05272.1 putative disulfide oxidoreductase YuzD [Lentibacillus kapialis]